MRTMRAVAALTALLLAACTQADAGSAPTTTDAVPPTTPATTAAESPEATTGPTSTTDAPSEPAAPTAAVAALDFVGRRLDGAGALAGADHAGAAVVLWMWTSWCPRCNREAPNVKEVVAAYGDAVTFIGIAGRDDDDAGRHEFVATHGLEDILQVVDDDGAIWSRYGISYQPAWVFVTPAGEMDVHAGPLYDDDLTERVAALVGA
jgi:thiol-disulfide isomerase/thioredoxin